MREPFDVADVRGRHSERRIRIVDMIGRRGRFMTLAMAGFFYLYSHVSAEQPAGFATLFLADNLFDAVVTSWIFLAFFYADGVLGAAFYGAQSRVMDGVLARANNLLITTLWTVFKFVLVPVGAQLAAMFPPAEFAVVFALIWGSYLTADAMAEIGGSLFGRQTIRVWGIGDVNRKSIEGTIACFAGSLVLCLWVVLSHGLPAPWIALAVVISISNTRAGAVLASRHGRLLHGDHQRADLLGLRGADVRWELTEVTETARASQTEKRSNGGTEKNKICFFFVPPLLRSSVLKTSELERFVDSVISAQYYTSQRSPSRSTSCSWTPWDRCSLPGSAARLSGNRSARSRPGAR